MLLGIAKIEINAKARTHRMYNRRPLLSLTPGPRKRYHGVSLRGVGRIIEISAPCDKQSCCQNLPPRLGSSAGTFAQSETGQFTSRPAPASAPLGTLRPPCIDLDTGQRG